MEFTLDELDLVIVEKNGLYGLVTTDGREMLEVNYSYVADTVSANGIIMVRDKEGNKRLVEILFDDDDTE